MPEISPKSSDLKTSESWGSPAFSFMNVTQGARTAAMGDAFSSVANDINAIFFNPAGLALIKRASYTFSYTRWLVDTAFYNGAVAYNTTKGVIGISLLNYDVGEMEVRTIYNPGGTGEKIKSRGKRHRRCLCLEGNG